MITNNELLNKQKQERLSSYLNNKFNELLNKTYNDITDSDQFHEAVSKVKESLEFRRRLEEYIERISATMALELLGIDNKSNVFWNIENEVNARLALTKIDNFNDIVKNFIETIDFENYIYKN